MILLVTGFYENANHGFGSRARRDDADFIIQELDVLDARIKLLEGLAQCTVQCVHRAVPHGGGMFDVAVHLDHDSRFGHGIGVVAPPFGIDPEPSQLENRTCIPMALFMSSSKDASAPRTGTRNFRGP